MVGEFPELQGLMGGYYARAEGLPDEVADAIRDHYKPVGQGDEVPTAPVTVAVSLADKLDTVISFFTEDMQPTGSKDPFALRRAALGILSLLTTSNIRMPLGKVVEPITIATAYSTRDPNGETRFIHFALQDGYREVFERATQNVREMTYQTEHFDELDDSQKKNLEQWFWDFVTPVQTLIGSVDRRVLDFFADRLKVQQREAGVRHDLIDAVFALGGEDDLVRLLALVKALQSFMDTEDGTNLLAGYKRAANILKKEEWDSAGTQENLSYTPEAAEKALIDALDAAEPRAAAAIEAEDFAAAMSALASLRAPIDAFFDEVTVNADEEIKRHSRLDLLARFRAAVHNVADFSRIEG
jgi:glycyl-tRNA synthetase beta chain